jgi:hypothetical protein
MAKLNHINVKNLSYKLVDARQRNGSLGTTKSDNIGWMKEIVAVNGHDPRCFFTKRFITVEARLKQILNGHI